MLLDQLLSGLDVGVAAFSICEIRGEASLVLEDEEATSIHYVLSGEGVARSQTAPAISLAPHTLVIAPPQSSLVVTVGGGAQIDLPPPKCEPLPGGWDRMIVGEGKPGIVLACGTVRAMHIHGSGLFDYLRAPLVESMTEEPSFRDPFRRLLDELAMPLPGTRSLAEVLMKECLIALLRRQCVGGECQVPWLTAIEHPRLGKAIAAMLEKPEAPHTLQSLADLAGMSRTVFSEHFKAAFGRTAMDFLREIRLRRAARLLLATDLPVKTIAYRVGFSSRSYFSRSFKSFTGSDPAHYRATAAQEPTRPERVVAQIGSSV